MSSIFGLVSVHQVTLTGLWALTPAKPVSAGATTSTNIKMATRNSFIARLL